VKRVAVVMFAVAVVAGCGGHASSTGLTIQVRRSAGAAPRVYRLECEPAKGTSRNPGAMCAALQRQPQLLSTPHSGVCGPNATPRERIRVTGSFRGRPVDARFQDGCSGQGDGMGAWNDLLEGA
jgi:hypothetical protein